MIGPCDCPEEEKPCYLCKVFQEGIKKRKAARREELGLAPDDRLPCRCSCSCTPCKERQYTVECEVITELKRRKAEKDEL